MCREHPESRYHDMLCFVLFAAKDICNRNNFILRYPHFLGSFLVRFSQVLIELGFDIISNRRNSMIIFSVSLMIFPRLCHMLFGVFVCVVFFFFVVYLFFLGLFYVKALSM